MLQGCRLEGWRFDVDAGATRIIVVNTVVRYVI